MKIHEVENMSADELKAGQAEIVKALDGNAELAVRYVQARLDAKIRDVKLAEQAKTLEALQTGLGAAEKQAVAAEAETVAVRQQLNADIDEANRTTGMWKDTVDQAAGDHNEDLESLRELSNQKEADTADFGRRIQILTERCERLKLQAQTYDSAITTIHKTAADAIASRELARADQGE